MFDLPAVRECLWWQNFTASEGIEAGLCRQIAVSVEVTCALKCSQIWWLNSLVSQELEVGFWYDLCGKVASPAGTKQFPAQFWIIFGVLSTPSCQSLTQLLSYSPTSAGQGRK